MFRVGIEYSNGCDEALPSPIHDRVNCPPPVSVWGQAEDSGLHSDLIYGIVLSAGQQDEAARAVWAFEFGQQLPRLP